MGKELDDRFLAACFSQKIPEAKALAAQGANLRATDRRNMHALHGAAPLFSWKWPVYRAEMQWLLDAGLSLNDQGELGTPLHCVAQQSGHHMAKNNPLHMRDFVFDAVTCYGGDLLAKRHLPAQQPQSVLCEFVRKSAADPTPVVKTAFSLCDGRIDDVERRELALSWISVISSTLLWNEKRFAWFMAGIDLSHVTLAEANRNKQGHILKAFAEWEEKNPPLRPEACHSKAQLLTPRICDEYVVQPCLRFGTPLFNPRTWDNMPSLLKKLARKGDPVLKEDMLKPIAGSMNFIQIAVEYMQRPETLFRTLFEVGIGLNDRDLLKADGTANATLKSLESNPVALRKLFSAQNWAGESRGAMMRVYSALAPETKKRVNMPTLSFAPRDTGSIRAR